MPRAFLYTLLGVNACLALAGAAYAAYRDIPTALAVPIVLAFLLQISFYLVPGFPEARRRLEERLSPYRLGILAVAAALAPYLIYSLPTGVFQFSALLKLALLSGVVTFTFVLWPTKSPRLTWQDLVVLTAVAVAELGRVFRQIYLSPVSDLRLESMGRIMIIGVGATAFLSLRRLAGTGYQFGMTGADWKTGLKQFAIFLPLGAAIAVLIRFARYRPVEIEGWMYPMATLGTFLGMYLVVALFEELLFRGILQNLVAETLGRPLASQAIASVAYGLSHLTFRSFPDWRFAMLATIAGWFYGQAYRERRSVVAASIAHALVNAVWRLLFAG